MRRFLVTALAVVTALAPAAPAMAANDPVLGRTTATLGSSGNGPELGLDSYRVSLPDDGSPRTFTVSRSKLPNLRVAVVTDEREGDALFATATHTVKVDIDPTSAPDNSCDSQTSTLNTDQPLGLMLTMAGSATAPKDDRDGFAYGECLTTPSWKVTITHKGVGSGTTPAEIDLFSEPRAAGNTGPKVTEAQRSAISAPKGKDNGTVTGGTAFLDATTLTPGSYTLSQKIGTVQTFRVRLTWGQRLAVTAQAPPPGSNIGRPIDIAAELFLRSPQRVDITSSGSDTYATTSLSANNTESKTFGSFTAPVEYTNRANTEFKGDVTGNALQYTSEAGWYYVLVSLMPQSKDDKITGVPDLPMTLNVAVTGTPHAGPDYVTTTGAKVAQPAAGQMSLGQGTDTGPKIPWIRLLLSVIAIALAAAAFWWARRRTA
ncbi:hypothetical protein G9U51_12070 [Calidifontibacter sp. DB0510]|uniref:Cell wall anchor protein n=1 Tax=Metallococcus carri TaxID=1656884 RepID=A0A967B3B6_9MICO|nr:hypothetical protein [Metallococcus carri]NHN56515.1 hypothetical protein [Metallococcus carri]NOP38814.1 hypothetical protein [Calidifontibacter sp. DB2511S]